MGKKLIIGLGTGRCGTTSLGRFLNAQSGIRIFHEGETDDGEQHPLPWEVDHEKLLHWLATLERYAAGNEYYGDIGMYFLPYAEYLIGRFPDIKLVCLKRDRKEVVASYMKWTKNRNHWLNHDGSVWAKHPPWDVAFPKFDEPDKSKAIGLYWDGYYREVERLIGLYPENIACFAMTAMNHINGRRAILDFIGYTGPRQLGGYYRVNRRHYRLIRSFGYALMAVLAKAIEAGRWMLPKRLRHFLWVALGQRVHDAVKKIPENA